MSTYVPIQAITLSAAASSVAFTAIPATFTDLVVVVETKTTHSASATLNLQFNSDTGSNYSLTRMFGNGSTVTSDRFSNQTSIDAGFLPGTNGTGFGQTYVHIMNYSNTTTNKTILNRWNSEQGSATAKYTAALVGLWRNTGAINRVQFSFASGNIDSGSTFTLYGIGSGSPKAFGGDEVRTDGTYWYHIFNSSGRFEPVENLTNVDYLVVAGGGGGGSRFAGGGGAGGFRTGTFSSLAGGTNYAVTVGAGGTGGPATGGTGTAGASNGGNGGNSVFNTITSTGGGGGAAGDTGNGLSGGSGGGAAGRFAGTGGAGTSGQGNAGGSANGARPYTGAGGGGAGASGGSNVTAAGGNGSASSITGTSVTYAGGGGGGGANDGQIAGGAGGTGGGGNGGDWDSNPLATAGTANTGGGGGGGAQNPTTQDAGANGGSGIVIVRYLV